MTNGDFSYAAICVAVYYCGALNLTWGELSAYLDRETVRRRWLQRHMVDLGRHLKAVAEL